MAAGNTYTPIQSITTSGSVTSVTFSSIPSTYTDLVLIGNTKFSGNRTFLNMRVNGDTATNYSYTGVWGNGTTAGSDLTSSYNYGEMGVISDQWQTNTLHLLNYANTTTYKIWLARGNSLGSTASQDLNAYVNLWRSTAAINSIYLAPANGLSITDGTMFTLYGILAA
jgi:hypothetical protein